MRIAILGAPGSGKGMQAKLLSAEHRAAHISANELLRAADAAGKLGRADRAALADGRIEGELIMRLLEERLLERDTRRGIIISGFPRNIPQAQELDTLLGARALQIALHISASDEQLARRLAGRLICGTCGATYNREYAPPQKRGKCDECGGKVAVERRGGIKTAAARIAAYNAEVAPLIAYYKAQHKLRTVAADGGPEEIRQKISDIVDLEIRPLQIKTLETAAESDTFDEEINTVIAGGQISRIAPHADSPAKKAGAKKPLENAPPEADSKSPAAKAPPAKNRETQKGAAKNPTRENP
ncbi:MAG: nucleoside monophosphate kinase [Gammaproteobacteria bacterium]